MSDENMRLSHSVRFTPHSIEDILRNVSGNNREVSEKTEIDSEDTLDNKTVRDDSRGYEVYMRETGRQSYRDYEEDRVSPINLCKYQTNRSNQTVTKYRDETEEEGILRREEVGILRGKKMRTTFTGRQIFELEKMFETKKYLNASERTQLSR